MTIWKKVCFSGTCETKMPASASIHTWTELARILLSHLSKTKISHSIPEVRIKLPTFRSSQLRRSALAWPSKGPKGSSATRGACLISVAEILLLTTSRCRIIMWHKADRFQLKTMENLARYFQIKSVLSKAVISECLRLLITVRILSLIVHLLMASRQANSLSMGLPRTPVTSVWVQRSLTKLDNFQGSVMITCRKVGVKIAPKTLFSDITMAQFEPHVYTSV